MGNANAQMGNNFVLAYASTLTLTALTVAHVGM
jgi:hypothetical protein